MADGDPRDDRSGGDRQGRLSRVAGEESDPDGEEREAWYEDHTRRTPRPWELASSDTETPSIREYLQQQRESGMPRRELALTVAGTLLLVLVPAALVGSILTLVLISVVGNPLLWWIGFTVLVLLLMLAGSELT